MGDFLSYKHSFNSGDLITVLPGIQDIYKKRGKKAKIYQRLNMPAYYFTDATHPVQYSGVNVCMNESVFNMMKPLLESQEYIESFEVWKGEKTIYDFDLTRHNSQIPLPAGDIHAWATLTFPMLQCDLSQPWLHIPAKSYVPYILINRTLRYNNPYIDYFFLKKYQDVMMFVGVKEEHEKFCNDFELNIPLAETNNFLELAFAISSCRFFMGNQSLCWHISDALKKPRVLEVCSPFPNCFPTGANGHSFTSQGSLEYIFETLLKKTE